jgi:hypothetical protein
MLAQDAVSQPDQPILSRGEIQALQSTPSRANSAPPISAQPNNAAPVADTPRRFQYQLSATLRGVYDDNIFIRSFDQESDFYFAIEPSIYLGFGTGESDTSLSFVYRPSLFLFVDHSDENTIQHLLRLQAAHRFSHLALTLAQDVSILDGSDLNSLSDPTGHHANIDVGGRTKHQIYNTSLGASYDLTGKLYLSAGGAFTADHYQDHISSDTISGNLFLNYNYSEKLTVGLGGTGGFNSTEQSGSDQTFEQANLRLSYNVTAKINCNASVGVEFRQFESSSDNKVTPVYELAASYQPFDGTSLTLSGSRRNENSATLFGQDYSETSIDFAISQRFLQRCTLTFAVGYINSDYFSAVEGVSATRNDDYFYIQPAIDVKITRYWAMGGYYMHRESSSSLDLFSFNDNQFGVRATLTF